jgi:hypothetical protein
VVAVQQNPVSLGSANSQSKCNTPVKEYGALGYAPLPISAKSEVAMTYRQLTAIDRYTLRALHPGGHLKFPHLWPGQTPPADVRGTW